MSWRMTVYAPRTPAASNQNFWFNSDIDIYLNCEFSVQDFLCKSYLQDATRMQNFLMSRFPRGIESIENKLNCEIGFKDLEKVLNLAKMYIKYLKSMEIPNSSICLLKNYSLPLIAVLQVFLSLCSMNKILEK